MATYVFKCRGCGTKFLAKTPDRVGESRLPCVLCGGDIVRDYHEEGVGLAGVVQMKREREVGGKEGMAHLFLPDNEDFKGPDDPDGIKGMRNWREEHQPRPSNKNPLWPGSVERKVY